ncbi:NYN domain-containing protein [Streptomyces telluris]|uniref:NTP pyrophosphohydrolase n=1 Tax=Streptomyces telluris TaxID=2720021 RepID=A0A9X2LIX7_9ACTN|nr:NYN domain-containing protein [Streptomyces telluris]MCQ8771774.1 NTP pyrophosphohydrolase [Streptomyces telluris]NJP78763.1 NYN domain-containing protein [Streptomyces telluris]
MSTLLPVLLVVDSANVVGSVPDGWWRDRRAATERLRDHLADRAARGEGELFAGTPEVVLVVEGKARGAGPVPGVRIEEAAGSGDDRIVELVAAREPGRRCVVVTADRALRARVTSCGAEVAGPSAVRP